MSKEAAKQDQSSVLNTSELPKINRSLGPRLLKYILIFSSLFTAGTTTVSYILDYNAELGAVEERLSQMESGTVSGIAGAMWEINDALVEKHLNGAIQITDVVSMKLFDETGKLVSERNNPELPNEFLIVKELPILHKSGGNQEKLGTLVVSITKGKILERIRNRAIWFFLLQGLKTFFVSFVILQIFHLLLTRYLSMFSKWVQRSDALEFLAEKAELGRKKGLVDELTIMLFSLREMSNKILDQRGKIEKILSKTRDERDEKALQLNRRNHQIETLASMNEDLSRNVDSVKCLEIGSQYMAKVIEGAPVFIFSQTTEDRNGILSFVARTSPTQNIPSDPTIELPTGSKEKSYDIRHLVKDDEKQEELGSLIEAKFLDADQQNKFKAGTWVILPLNIEKQPWGIVAFKSLPGSNGVIHRFVRSLGAFYENCVLHERVVEYSIKDQLTGLYNVRHFRKILEIEQKRCSRSGSPLCLLFIDIDKFKTFNDTHGHIAGDQLLSEFAKVLKAQFRTTDLVVRYGGEEFAVLLHETTLEGATHKAKQLCNKIKEHPFRKCEQQPFGSLTISIGVSCLDTNAKSTENFVKKADDALYIAKKRRNCVEVSTSLDEETEKTKIT